MLVFPVGIALADTTTSGGAPTGVLVRETWTIHQDKYPFATDLHFKLNPWEPWVDVNGWSVTISHFTSSSSQRSPGNPDHEVDVTADGAIIPYCTWVTIEVEFWLTERNSLVISNVTWTNGTDVKKAMPDHGWSIDYPTPISGQYFHEFTIVNDDANDTFIVSGLAFNPTMDWYDDLESVSFPPSPYADFTLAPGQNWSTDDIITSGDLVGGHIYFQYDLVNETTGAVISENRADHPVTPRPAGFPALTPPGFILALVSLLGLAVIVTRKMHKR